MDSKVNFTLVGMFLFIFIGALVSFTFWLGKYGTDTKKVDYYKVHLTESISGLNIESSIKYKGLNIGVVKDIKINPNNSTQIEVLLEVNGGSPIKVDTVAVLESQGITGLKYIDLVGGSHTAPLLKSKTNAIPIIQSKLSFFGTLGNSAEDITVKVNNLLDKMNYLLNKENINQISTILDNANNLTNNLNSLTGNLNNKVLKFDTKVTNIMTNIDSFTNNLDSTLTKINTLIEKDAQGMIKNIATASNAAQVTFEEFSRDINDGKLDLEKITEDSLKRFDALMVEFDRTMQNAAIMIEKYGDSPSDLIFKNRSDEFGPGEKNE